MRKVDLFVGVIVGAVIVSIIGSSEAAEYYGKFPPTPAFRNFTDGSNIIEADSYADVITFTGGDNMTLVYFPNNDTIRFNAVTQGGGGGGGSFLPLAGGTMTGLINLNGVAGFGDLQFDSNSFLNDSGVNAISVMLNGNEFVRWQDANAIYRISSPIQSINYRMQTTFNPASTGIVSLMEWGANTTNNGQTTFGALRVQANDISNTTGEDGQFEFILTDEGVQASALFLSATVDMARVKAGWDLAVGPGDKLFFDSGSNTFLYEIGPDDMQFKSGGAFTVGIENSNIRMGTFNAGSGKGVIILGNNLPPTTNIANAIQLYTNDTSPGNAELYVRDENGNITILSPHDCFGDIERKASTDWFFCSENPYIGKGIAVSNYEVIRTLEELSGKTLLHEYNIPIERQRNWLGDQLLLKVQEDKGRLFLIEEKAKLEVELQAYQNELNRRDLPKRLVADITLKINALQMELDGIEIPDPYVVKERPTYFDMAEITR